MAGQRQATEKWWKRAPERFELFVSQFVLEEAGAGDRVASAKRLAVLANLPVLAVSDDVSELAEHLVESRILPAKAADDALHLSISAVHGMEYLLTWNCKHLANSQLRRKIEEACKK